MRESLHGGRAAAPWSDSRMLAGSMRDSLHGGRPRPHEAIPACFFVFFVFFCFFLCFWIFAPRACGNRFMGPRPPLMKRTPHAPPEHAGFASSGRGAPRRRRRGAEDNKEMAEETFLRPLGGLLGASRRPKGYRRATEMLPKAAGRLRVRLMVGAPHYDS